MKRALLFSAGTLLLPATVLAQATPAAPAPAADARLDPDAPPTNVHVVDDAEAKPPLVPRANDLLGAHVLVGAAVGPAWSLGSLGSNVATARGLGTGIGVGVDAGFGLSRNVVVGAWGNFVGYGNGDACSSCAGRSLAVGPFVRYHLLQGLRFDPWLSLGAGYRRINFENDAGSRQKFSGVEWLNLQLGGDYYVLSGLGFGPYGSLALSSYNNRPSGSGSATVNTELSVGVRFLFDLPGR